MTINNMSIKEFSVSYFALVMATGIISIGSFLLNMKTIAYVLFWFNLVVFPVLLFLFFARLFAYFQSGKKGFDGPPKRPLIFHHHSRGLYTW
jgi:tellurite resistance protein TehA-like permease